MEYLARAKQMRRAGLSSAAERDLLSVSYCVGYPMAIFSTAEA